MKNKKQNNLMSSKKAEMTGTAIIEVLVLIASIVVIFLFWVAFNWNPTINKETCHESVVLRSSFNIGFLELSKKAVPLKCQTEKICLGRNCESNFGKATKENLITQVKLSSDKTKAKEEVLDAIANSMYDCHSMLGEGKLDFMPSKGWTKNYCLICSRFALDNKTAEKVGDIGYGELYKYLGEKKNSDGKSYLEYLYPQWKNWEDSKKLFEVIQKNPNNKELTNIKFEDWKMNMSLENGYVIISQMDVEGWADMALKITTLTTAGVLIITGVGAPIGATILTGIGVGGISMWYNHPQGNYVYSPPSIYTYDVESLKSLKCSSFETAP